MWDKEGVQTIVDGNGNYSWDSPIIGFTEHGFTHYNRAGAVVNGFPDEASPVVFSHPNGEKQTVGVEAFADGAIRDVIHTNFLRYYYGEDATLFAFSILPNDYFPRAEFLLPKGCTFDEFANFDAYLILKFNRFLKECAESLEFNTKVTYKVRVNKNGLPTFRGLTSEETLSSSATVLAENDFDGELLFAVLSFGQNDQRPTDHLFRCEMRRKYQGCQRPPDTSRKGRLAIGFGALRILFAAFVNTKLFL